MKSKILSKLLRLAITFLANSFGPVKIS